MSILRSASFHPSGWRRLSVALLMQVHQLHRACGLLSSSPYTPTTHIAPDTLHASQRQGGRGMHVLMPNCPRPGATNHHHASTWFRSSRIDQTASIFAGRR
ncbi:hypothetical protein BJY00DRAFT_70689 [Aspergillus carlsbadensis]|nr:hypothetical protein BJY00DRAFT_70689 [Aspergillus carlsbadensis]